MSRPTILIASLIASLGLNAAVIASGAPPASPAPTSASQPAQTSASVDDRAAIKPGDQNCLRHTGSLIPPKKGECMHAVGRSYSGDQMRRTGTQDNARALQMLDPSITVGH